MTDGELMAIEQRLLIWKAGLNALGSSEQIPEDRQRATDQWKLLVEVRRLRKYLKVKSQAQEKPSIENIKTTDADKAPLWYHECEIIQAMQRGTFLNQNESMSAGIARHLQLAFEKGFSIGIRRTQKDLETALAAFADLDCCTGYTLGRDEYGKLWDALDEARRLLGRGPEMRESQDSSNTQKAD